MQGTQAHPRAAQSGTAGELRRVQRELETARAHFDMAEDSDLIDCCIHQIIALEKRYSFLLRQLREPADRDLTAGPRRDRMGSEQ